MNIGDHVKVNRATWDFQAARMSDDPLKECQVGVVLSKELDCFYVRFGDPPQTKAIHRDYLIPDMLLISEMP